MKQDKNRLPTKFLHVILSEVEVSPSEERGETKAPKRRRDLVTSFGDFLQ